jgi:tetratricopeptide (TPR) repeat protein
MLVQHFATMLAVSATLLLGADAARDRFDAGVRAQKAGNLQSAAIAYREALAENPQLIVARHLLGVCELQLGNLAEGMRQLELVLRANPSNRQPLIRWSRLTLQQAGWIRLGRYWKDR